MTVNKIRFTMFFLLVFYFASRILFIFKFPLFHDEAMYIHWAQAVADDWFNRYVSLIDGKQPLFIWLASLSLQLVKNPIVAGRLVSVFSGALSLLGIYLIGKELFDYQTGMIASLIYIIIPFTFIYDGLALMDSLLLMLGVYACFLTIKLVKNQQKEQMFLLGFVLGLGLLTKSSAVFFIYLLPFSLIVAEKEKNIKRLLILFLGAIGIAKLIEAVMRFSIYYPIIESKNHQFIYTFKEIFHNPLIGIKNNLFIIPSWIISYLGVPVIIFACLSLVITKEKKAVVFTSLYTIIPIVVSVIFAKLSYPRHFLFAVWPILLLAAVTVNKLTKLISGQLKYLIILVLFVIVIGAFKTDLNLLFNTSKASLPSIERWQFFEGEPSGYGLENLYDFFDVKKEKILVFTDRSMGILADGLAIHYQKNNLIKIVGSDEITKNMIIDQINRYRPDKIYLILSWQMLPEGIEVVLEKEIIRPGGLNHYWRIYRLTKTPSRKDR